MPICVKSIILEKNKLKPWLIKLRAQIQMIHTISIGLLKSNYLSNRERAESEFSITVSTLREFLQLLK